MKEKHIHKDPIRYPKIIKSYEGESKEFFSKLQKDTFIEIFKKMYRSIDR